ncbi:hypothetical protein HG530_009692 [Fusarium avenaceum]|nr:hypothetical protein HG530_009692 [Fusarium avenaceum]
MLANFFLDFKQFFDLLVKSRINLRTLAVGIYADAVFGMPFGLEPSWSIRPPHVVKPLEDRILLWGLEATSILLVKLLDQLRCKLGGMGEFLPEFFLKVKIRCDL